MILSDSSVGSAPASSASLVSAARGAGSLPNTFSIVYWIAPKSTLPVLSFVAVVFSGLGAPSEPSIVYLPVMSGALVPDSTSSVLCPLILSTALSSAPYIFLNVSTFSLPSGYTTSMLRFPLPSSVTITLIGKLVWIPVTPSAKLLSSSTTL